MSVLRHWVGLTRDGFAPWMDRSTRATGRRRLANELAQYVVPEAFKGIGARSRIVDLYPPQWRMLDHQAGHHRAVVWLRPDSPADTAAEFAETGCAADWLSFAACDGTATRLVAPGHWSNAQRLLALANSGLLDGYDELVVVEDRVPATIELTAALAALSDPAVGGSCPHLTRHGRRVTAWVDARLRELHWEADGSDSDRPTDLDLTCRAFVIQGLRAMRLSPDDLASADDTSRLACLIGTLAAEAGARIDATPATARRAQRRATPPLRPRIVAFYLPQFHPTDHNDRWWGRGFTEWTTVTDAVPSFRGHFQPKLPADLGFYDLRLDRVRAAQDQLATAAGMAGFMYYDYWFQGEKVLDQPLLHLDRQAGLHQQHCLMWANENWTRTWYNDPTSVLMAQEHDRVSPVEYLRQALPFLRHERYLTVHGAKVLAVYRPETIPDFPAVARDWRRVADGSGLQLMLLAVESGPMPGEVLEAVDATMAFPPHRKQHVLLNTTRLSVDRRFHGRIFSYRALVDADVDALAVPHGRRFPGVMSGWDNSARRQRTAHIWVGANPYTFRRWLLAAATSMSDRPADERIVFVNAWNEWAESAVLEPSVESGASYLAAVRDIARS